MINTQSMKMDTSFAQKLYNSMLYRIVFDAVPKLLERLVGEGGFIGVYSIIADASKAIYTHIIQEMGFRPSSLREAAVLMKVMAGVHNGYTDSVIGAPKVHVEIKSDHEAFVVCRSEGFEEERRYLPVVFMGLVGGFLEALGFRVKPLRSPESMRFLNKGELGVYAEGDSRECTVKVVARE